MGHPSSSKLQPNPTWSDGGASFDRRRIYRYRLWRQWDASRPTIGFVGLNPSTADHRTDDPTLRRLLSFSKAWGFGALELVNLYAYRATDPTELRTAQDPVGPRTDVFVRRMARTAETVVVCWGAPGAKGDRAEALLTWMARRGITPYCLGTNKDGSPKHPLYLPKSTERVPYVVAPKRGVQ